MNITTDPIVPIVQSPTFACGYNVSCNGASNGSVNLTVTGGCLPYTYAWSGPNGFSAVTEDIANLRAGTYTVVVTDLNGDQATISITLSQPAALSISGLNSPILTCGSNISCNGGSNGSIDLTVAGGASCLAYQYSWTGPNGFTATTEDLSNLSAGTYTVVVTDANGCTTTGNITLTQAASVQLDSCGDQWAALGYEPEQCVTLAPTVVGGCGPYTWSWLNGQTTPTITVCPAFTTRYGVVVTDANGCRDTLYQTVNVLDIRCAPGSRIQRNRGSKYIEYVMMCHTTTLGPQTECVKGKDVQRRLNAGWTLGPCGTTFDNPNCPEPDYFSCNCNGGLTSACFTYNGPAGANVVITADGAGNRVLGTWTNVQPGQVLCVNGSTLTGGILKSSTYIRVNGGSALAFYTACDRATLGEVEGAMTLTSWTDESNSICNSQAQPDCNCSGALTSVTLTYVGPGPANINVYASNNLTQLIASFTNVTTGSPITINGNPGLPNNIYLQISGNPNVTMVKTTCKEIVIGDRIYYFDVLAWTDSYNTNCNGTPNLLKHQNPGASAGNGLGEGLGLSAYPNPFNETTTVEFRVPKTEEVVLKVFNLQGEEVATLFEGEAEEGASYKVTFRPEAVSNGVYIAKMVTSGGETKFEKLVLQK